MWGYSTVVLELGAQFPYLDSTASTRRISGVFLDTLSPTRSCLSSCCRMKKCECGNTLVITGDQSCAYFYDGDGMKLAYQTHTIPKPLGDIRNSIKDKPPGQIQIISYQS
jgi:hypothetical protein